MYFIRITAFVCLLCMAPPLFGQTRSTYFDQPARVVPPADYDPERLYPAIVFLPYTTGTSEAQARSFGISPENQTEFVVILPAGRFNRDDYLPNFMQFVQWYEERLLEDIANAFQHTSIDPNRLYLAGYSLGGDLAWALSVRNPEFFAGAVMAGTRASYPLTDDARRSLTGIGYRGSFLIGNREIPERQNGIERAHASLEGSGIPTLFRTYQGGHQIPPRELLLESIAFVTQNETAAEWVEQEGSRATRGGEAGSGIGGMDVQWDRILHTAALRTPGQHFGIRYDPGFEIGAEGFRLSPLHAGQLRAEGLFDDVYLRGITSLESRGTSGDYRLKAFRQEVAVAYGRGSLWGAGFSWDWNRWMTTGNADLEDAGTDALHRFGISVFWIHPRRMRGIPASVLELRYFVPHTFKPFIPQEVFNAQVRYHLHVTDRIMLQTTFGSWTEQNMPLADRSGYDSRHDHVMGWNAGAGFRIPGPFRWNISHHGRWVKPAGGNPHDYRGSWRFSVEYLF